MLIHWSDEAQADARGILGYIAQDSLAAAYGVYEEIDRQADLLAEHPKLGRMGRVKGTRELIISGTPYIVTYQIKGDAVLILRVLHGAQKWPKRFS